ncbi:translesion DNA synthesis-associated protein ImuA [Lysobacter terrestris]|uniref:Translesion DNA synthesis-associated protein ImuA n=1 Tax=Agrilutibacter terrestris TaxID=2865112 RepID=A0A7H0FXB2_9GAMM|nr:translesion DNA synthesis-associated protein ImuA [Lysobacter terrestris]
MGTVTALAGAAAGSTLDGLISQRRIWRGQSAAITDGIEQSTGWPALDAALPARGWPHAALSELLLPADGIGELQLLWPTLARLSAPKDGAIALVAPPYLPYPSAWHAAGVRLDAVQVIRTKTPREALWAAEQCLRSGACDAVLCWPQQADDRALRRLQVAAETGQALGFVIRSSKAAMNPSPAALRIALEASPRQLRILKCRGGNPPARAIPFPQLGHPEPPVQASILEPAAHGSAAVPGIRLPARQPFKAPRPAKA